MKYVMLAVMAVVLVGCFPTVEAGYVGVATSMGSTRSEVYPEGTHMVAPWVSMHEMSVRLQVMDEQNVECRSENNVEIEADVTVQFALNARAAAKVYKMLGEQYASTVLRPAVRSAVRDAVAAIDAMAVAQSRSSIEDAIRHGVASSMVDTLKNHGVPQNAIILDNVQLRNVDLPASLRASIEHVQQAGYETMARRQQVLTAQQEAARLVAQAEGAARVATVEATNRAEVRRIDAESQSAYYRQIGLALNDNVLALRRIEMQQAIASSNGTRTVIFGAPNTSPMLMNLGQ